MESSLWGSGGGKSLGPWVAMQGSGLMVRLRVIFVPYILVKPLNLAVRSPASNFPSSPPDEGSPGSVPQLWYPVRQGTPPRLREVAEPAI